VPRQADAWLRLPWTSPGNWQNRVRLVSRIPYRPGVHLREEVPADAEAVREVHLTAFGDHGTVVADLTDSLRHLPGLSLVAEVAGRLVGHVLFTRNLLDAPKRLVDVQVLSPVAVLPSHQRQGIGAALIRKGLDTLADRNVPAVFLEGDPRYYSRLGFTPAGDRGYRRPSLRIPEPAFQVYELPAHEPWMTGTLVYAEEFWRHDAVGLRP
jgi:putative acetyltransferase